MEASTWLNPNDVQISKNSFGRYVTISSEKWNSILRKINQSETNKLKIENKLNQIVENQTEKLPNINDKNKYENQNGNSSHTIIDCENTIKRITLEEKKLRQEKIQRVQKLIERKNDSQIELQSAALLSEVLRCQKSQREINAENNKMKKQKILDEIRDFQMQSEAWIFDQQRKMLETKKRNNEYKRQVLADAQEKNRQKLQDKKSNIEAEKLYCEKEFKKTRDMLQQNDNKIILMKDTLKETAVEAVRMAEQKRLREKMEDDINEEIIKIYSKGKNIITDIRKAKLKERQKIADLNRENNAKKLSIFESNRLEDLKITETKNNTKYCHDFGREDENRRETIKQLRQDRIQQRQKDIEDFRTAKARDLEEIRYGIANRLKNDEINREYAISKKKEKLNRASEIRTILEQQKRERIAAMENERKLDIACTNFHNDKSEEDRKYFSCAKNLIDEATKRDQPLYPIIKAVKEYKKLNEIDSSTTEPLHLKSHIALGTKRIYPKSNCQQLCTTT